ncbi:DNA primase [uncultured Victivallis sp.]|uniref:DNA primase n=1 Tax=uncultured Victivallis sp. TaxID=354118 RepID=UPI0025E1F70A|nr:DNA primase [uncultured Victivallis sp.]
MAFGVSKDVIEEIRSRCDIVDLIGSVVPLKRSGTNTYKGLCPFHQEKTPSFHVDAARQMYHCFGCGKGGDVFRFCMERENVGFSDALHMLAARVGVVIPENSGSDADPAAGRRRADARERLYRINEDLCCFFERTLQSNPDSPAARYLAGRGIPREVAGRFRIGAAPDDWTACLRYGRSLGYTDEELVVSGIVRRKEETGRLFDHFKGRLTFAITNEQGRVVGFSARSLEAKPVAGKYINTPESPVFKKGNLLYALPLARKMMVERNMAILCEGQLDAIAFHRAGLECAVAPQGTGFTEGQARILKRYASRVYLAFDADSAGQKAILRAVEILLPLSMEVRVIRIPGGKDPDELFRNGGAAAVVAAVDAAVPWLEVLAGSLPERYDMNSPAGRGQAAAEVAGYLLKVTNQVELELYIRQAATLLQVSEEAFYSELRLVQSGARRAEAFRPARESEEVSSRPQASGRDVAAGKTLSPGLSAALLTLLELALLSEDAARRLGEIFDGENETLDESNPVEKALNVVIGAALNGEHEHAASLLADLQLEEPAPEISRVLVERREFADPEKALRDAVAQLHRERSRESRAELMRRLRGSADPAERMEILKAISKLR